MRVSDVNTFAGRWSPILCASRINTRRPCSRLSRGKFSRDDGLIGKFCFILKHDVGQSIEAFGYDRWGEKRPSPFNFLSELRERWGVARCEGRYTKLLVWALFIIQPYMYHPIQKMIILISVWKWLASLDIRWIALLLCGGFSGKGKISYLMNQTSPSRYCFWATSWERWRRATRRLMDLNSILCIKDIDLSIYII